MNVALMQHQRVGVDFLTSAPAGLLAFEQGLGKTLVAIEAFKRVRAAGAAERMLVICPNSLKRNWVAELKKFAPQLSVTIAEGTPKERKKVFAAAREEIVITSYETARTEVTAVLAFVQRQPTALVLDESHAAKNWTSLTSAAMRHFAPHCQYRWLLSGTPVTNSPADIYTQIEILAPGQHLLGSKESFLASMAQDPSAEFARGVFGRLILRRTKEECLDLPEKTFADVRVELPAWQRKLYDDMRTRMVADIRAMSGEQYRAFASTALTQLLRLSQLASNPGLLFPDLADTPAKFDAIDGLVHDILSVPGRKVIIWSAYVHTIEALLARLASKGAVALYGATPNEERQEIASRFQTDPDTRVLIANPAAAGTGFTFTAATFAIYESLTWRYDHYAQSQDRNHRIGQAEPVTYIRLLAAETIEEAIVSALERKAASAGALLGDSDPGFDVNNLTQEEMCALLQDNALPKRTARPAEVSK